MRLLHYNGDGALSSTEFFEDHIPQYAILSHVWGAEEVTFKDLIDGTGKSKAGYHKIQFCGEQAREDGLRYFWVDTCCIDKSNSTELSESINSMFSWYKNAAKCYVYLSDVSTNKASEIDTVFQTWETSFRNSKWFTRGWTLQELLAPTDLQFFDHEWQFIGSKNKLKDMISTITNINPDVLAGQDFNKCSIAQRMSWAAHRTTTRSEDTAYCLIGLFDVNIPLLYGEGQAKAFRRLQEEIIKKTDDHSLFAWELQPRYAVHGLFAPSPRAFKNSQYIVPSVCRGPKTPYSPTNQGLQMTLPMGEHSRGGIYAAALNCIDQRTGTRLGIYLKQIGENRFVRTRLDQLPKLGLDRWARVFKPFEYRQIYIPQVPLTPYRPQHRFRSHPKLATSVVRKAYPYPLIKDARAIIAACSICRGCPARRAAAQFVRCPR